MNDITIIESYDYILMLGTVVLVGISYFRTPSTNETLVLSLPNQIKTIMQCSAAYGG